MQKLLPWNEQVRAALSEPTTSDALKALIESTGFELEATRQRLQAAKAKAVDPMSSDVEAAEARRSHHDLGFEEERQASSIARLKHRLAAILEDEGETRRREAYDGVVKDRDDLASRLAERYPALAGEIASLLSEVQGLNHRVREVNAARPRGAEWLQPVEHVARGPVTPEYIYSREPAYNHPPSLVRSVALPKFGSMEAKGAVGYLWMGLEKAD